MYALLVTLGQWAVDAARTDCTLACLHIAHPTGGEQLMWRLSPGPKALRLGVTLVGLARFEHATLLMPDIGSVSTDVLRR